MATQTVLIAGGSGLIGSRLQVLLAQNGCKTRLLTRTPSREQEFAWHPERGELDERAFEGVEAVVNLAGAGIADKRWSAARKNELISSRVKSQETLFAYFQRSDFRPSCYISASAIGIYGDSGESLMRETDPPAKPGFMVDCCQQWEDAALKIADLGVRTAILRIGVVLAREAGALPEIAKPLRLGLGTYFADGSLWYAWIHRDDVCRMIEFCLNNGHINGIYNAVAPQPERIKTLVQQTAAAMNKNVVMLPVPAFVLKMVLGEMAAVVLNSNCVSAQKITDAGFDFHFPSLRAALRDLFS